MAEGVHPDSNRRRPFALERGIPRGTALHVPVVRYDLAPYFLKHFLRDRFRAKEPARPTARTEGLPYARGSRHAGRSAHCPEGQPRAARPPGARQSLSHAIVPMVARKRASA